MSLLLAVARNQSDHYVSPQRPRLPAGTPTRAGSGTGPVRGGPQTAVLNPIATRGGKIERSILLQVIVNADGNVGSLRAMSPDKDSEHTRAALQAAKDWKFIPPTSQGQPIEQFGILTVYFDY